MVPAMKDRPFCGLLVVSHGGAVSYRGANVQKILFGADKGRSHKTSRSLIRGSHVAGTTVQNFVMLPSPETFILPNV